MTNLSFRMMAAAFRIRDWFLPPAGKLQEAGVELGHRVLDFGCGPGAYSLAAARMVGKNGRVYALDILPVAIESVKTAAVKQGLANLEFIRSGLETGLAGESVDVVLLYDIFHHSSDAERVLQELHRVLKPDGVLSMSDHHLTEKAIVARITKSGFFDLGQKGKATYTFLKRGR